MIKLLQRFGFITVNYIEHKECYATLKHADIDMEAFSTWCKELNVSVMQRSSEFTVRVGDHVKHVTLERI